MTLQELLLEGTAALEQGQVPDAALDAKQLLMASFGLDMTHFLLEQNRKILDPGQESTAVRQYRELIRRRGSRCPLQQILGSQEFMGMEFEVDSNVLVPRQDTETLVELVLMDCQTDTRPALLDLCTGSGCIAISLARKGGFCSVTATDLSETALEVARRNAKRLSPGKLSFYQGDLFEALPKGSVFDIITANPPYIPTAEIAGLEPEVREHEPRMALDGSADGLAFYRRIAAQAGSYLREHGRLYLEIGYDQGMAVSGLLCAEGWKRVQIHKDLAGNDRVVSASK